MTKSPPFLMALLFGVTILIAAGIGLAANAATTNPDVLTLFDRVSPSEGLRAKEPMTTATASATVTTTATPRFTPEAMPDLLIRDFDARHTGFIGGCIPPGSSGFEMLVTVANAGSAPAGPFLVTAGEREWSVDGLDAGAEALLIQGWDLSALQILVDPLNAVEESDEQNNVMEVAAPPPPTQPPTCEPTLTSTPSPTPTRPAYIPLTSLNLDKDELVEPWLHFGPRDLARPLRLPTLDGTLGILPGDPGDESYIFIGRHPYSILSQQIWEASVQRLVETSPTDVHWVFMAYEDSDEAAEAVVQAQRDRIFEEIDRLAADRAHWEEHLHFVKVNPMTLDSWITNLLEDWGSSNPLAVLRWQEGGQPIERTLDTTADSGWAPQIGEDDPMEGRLAWFGLACNGEDPAQSVEGKIALIERGVCPFTDKVLNAERFGATGVLMFSDDRPKTQMAGSCETCPNISVVMIDQAPGQEIRDQVVGGNEVTVSVSNFWAQAHGFGIDHDGVLREFGWIPYGFPQYHTHQFDLFEQIAFEAQHYHFEHGIKSRMRAEEEAGEVEVLPVFEGVLASDPTWSGRRTIAEVELPSAEEMKQFDKLEVDLKLACRNGEDANCGDWDYLVYFYLCDDPDNPNACNNEIGRFITAYKRQSHWVTDISPMLGYFQEGGTVRLGFWTVQPYVLDMSLRFGKSEEAEAAGGENLVPSGLQPLFGPNGRFNRTFDEDYNDAFEPITVTVPAGVEKVELVTIISGHGFAVDSEQCAEFCNHTHRFTIDGDADDAVYIDHPIMDDPVGADIGCALQVLEGVTPNQFGTWPFGRAAWCPGQDVPVKRHDLTDRLVPGKESVIEYFGGLRGQPYAPVRAPGVDPEAGWDMRIEMKSFLLYWSRPEGG